MEAFQALLGDDFCFFPSSHIVARTPRKRPIMTSDHADKMEITVVFQCPLKAWSESKVQSTKLNIIMSLSLYGEKGMEEFEHLERECTDKDDSFLFKQVRVFDSYIKNLAR